MGEFSELEQKMRHTDHTLWLGRLCWYTVTDCTVPHEKLVQYLVQNGLSAFLPRVPADSDAFRRACTGAEVKRVSTGDSDVYDNYLVRKFGKGGRLIARIVRERVDAKTEKVAFETELCKLTWTKDNPAIDVQCVGHDETAAAIAQRIVKAYMVERGTMNSYAVRELIRRVLLSVNATNVRGVSGGVYFINEAHGNVVENLEGLAASLPGSVVVHSLPLLDDDKQREMLKRAYESEAVDEINRAIDEIIEIRKDGKPVSSQIVANYLDTLTKAQGKNREYTGLLQVSLDSAASRISILRSQVMELSANVKEG